MTIVERARKDGGTSFGVKVWRHDREVWVGTERSRRAARALEREHAQREHGTSRELLADFVARWPIDYARPAASTNARNRYQAQHLAADYGSVELAEFTRAHARAFARRRPWAAQVARQLFADALADDLVAFNPFDRLTLPRGRGRADVEHVPGVDDLGALCGAAIEAHGARYGSHFAAAITLSFYAGLRAGELMALRVADIDLERCVLTVRHSLGHGGILKPPKNGRVREVVLAPQAIGALVAAAGTAPLARDEEAARFVFLGPRGFRLSKSTHHRLWQHTRQRLADPRWTGMPWHLWRHACATFLLDHRGLSHADVAQHLGHRDATLVLALYGHPSQRLAADRIREAMSDQDW